MRRNNPASMVRGFFARWMATVFVFLGVVIMSSVPVDAADSKLNVGGTGEGFGVYGLGGMNYGINAVSVWLSGNIRVGRFDTIQDMSLHGVGIFDNRLSPDDLKLANDIHRQLCAAAQAGPRNEVPRIDPPTLYDVECLQNGKLVRYQGPTYQLPRELFDTVVDFFMSARNGYLPESRTVVRLDVEVVNVEKVKNKFLVSIRLINGGYYPITMDTPDKWSTVMAYRLGFGGENESDKTGWGGSDLAGLPLVNQSEFPDGKVVIPARGSVTFEFLTLPSNKFTRGTYTFNASVNAEAYVPDVTPPGMGRVDFHSDYSKPTRITFDHDWPSTPEELREYEAREREKMSLQPVYPGQPFAMDGYYRAVSGSHQRSRFVRAFSAGDTAPDLKGVMDEKGKAIYGKHPGWVWYADRSVPVDGKPGNLCPRSGQWYARINRTFSYDDSLNEVIHRYAGESLPPSRRVSEGEHYYLEWHWLGV